MSAGAGSGASNRSIANLRGLLRDNLVERAVASSELRWPGSGPMVRLIHEWSELPAPTRRQRMAEIGPEELAKFRFLGGMNPELERVLDDLESRGIIPPAAGVPEPALDDASVDAVLTQVMPADGRGADGAGHASGTISATTPVASTQPESFEAKVVDAVVDYAASGAQVGADRVEAAYAAGELDPARIAYESAAELATQREALAAAGLAGVGAGAIAGATQRRDATREWDRRREEEAQRRQAASIDLHAETQERMQQAFEQASSILDRVRSTVDRHARTPVSSWAGSSATTARLRARVEPLLSEMPDLPRLPALRPLDPSPADVSDRELTPVALPVDEQRRALEAARREAALWIERFAASPVVVADAADGPAFVEPSVAALQELARALRLPIVQLDAVRQSRHEVWGGLRREGRTVQAFGGALPVALAQGALVVLRGQLPRGQQERIVEGYVDIPGTRATMRVHPSSRLLVLPAMPSAMDFSGAFEGLLEQPGQRRGRR